MSPRPTHRPTSQRGRRRDTLALGAAVVIAVPAVIWAGMRLTEDGSGQGTELIDDPGVAHIHGLGINPADGSLVVATHYGSFRIPSDGDEATRIGDSYQDTMGFTVAGPDRFLGSGHPDVAGMRAGQPGQLGLIESTDAGATWTSLSLSGEVDFHGLAYAHDQVYGWDSGTGRFMVSGDREDWDTRSTLDLFGFAVDPEDPEHIVGATPDGSAESTDGGRTWIDTDNRPFVALSWDPDAGLWGATVDGAVWHRSDVDWEVAGTLPGEPQAFLATPAALYAAAHDETGTTGIYRSTDDGATWQLRYRDPDR